MFFNISIRPHHNVIRKLLPRKMKTSTIHQKMKLEPTFSFPWLLRKLRYTTESCIRRYERYVATPKVLLQFRSRSVVVAISRSELATPRGVAGTNLNKMRTYILNFNADDCTMISLYLTSCNNISTSHHKILGCYTDRTRYARPALAHLCHMSYLHVQVTMANMSQQGKNNKLVNKNNMKRTYR